MVVITQEIHQHFKTHWDKLLQNKKDRLFQKDTVGFMMNFCESFLKGKPEQEPWMKICLSVMFNNFVCQVAIGGIADEQNIGKDVSDENFYKACLELLRRENDKEGIISKELFGKGGVKSGS
jgi:hypothetical protein